MKSELTIYFFLLTTLLFSCKQEHNNIKPKVEKPNKIILISINAPTKYTHLIKQDSVGKKIKDSFIFNKEKIEILNVL